MSAWLDSVVSGLTSRADLSRGHVRVECPIGGCTFPRCTVDIFDPGVLTITTLDDDMELRTFAPGTWLEATAYDGQGNLLFAFVSAAGKARAERLAS